MGEAYLKMKLKDQEASLAMIEADPDLKGLNKARCSLLAHASVAPSAFDPPTLPECPTHSLRPPYLFLSSVQVRAPLVDIEVRGVPALQYFGDVVWKEVYDGMNSPRGGRAAGTGSFSDVEGRKYFLMGGKGGVGKTSCSASLAVKFASEGLPTLVGEGVKGWGDARIGVT